MRARKTIVRKPIVRKPVKARSIVRKPKQVKTVNVTKKTRNAFVVKGKKHY